jgi:hypothetical protein
MEYKWFFDESGVLTECEPRVDGDTKLEYAPETNEVFYRAKLNGTLSFRLEFDDILAKGFGHTHVVVLQRYNENQFVEVWRGRFVLTDCTIDYETHTIEVQPETIDRYTAVLDILEKEYNLVKLKARMSPVNILIRPIVQVYKAGGYKISNYVGNNGWESEIEPTGIAEMELGLGFVELRDCVWFSLDYNTGPYVDKKTIYFVRFIVPDFYSDLTMPVDGRVYNADGTYVEDNTLECRVYHTTFQPNKWTIEIYVSATQTKVLTLLYDRYECNDNYESYEKGTMVDDFVAFWDRIYGRILCQTDLQTITIGVNTYTLLDINDADPIKNKNYNKILPFAPAYVEPSIDVSVEPTSWPQDSNGMYFVKPQNTPTAHYFAVGPDTWIDVAYWWYVQNSAVMATINEQLTMQRQIRDCYDYRSVILKLLNKAGVNPQYIISYCLGGTNDYVGARTDLRITPRSNVISSYYDTPAQNAPITLAKVLNMLKSVYQCYWYIDNNGNFHIEHISYFDNGYSTTEDEPELLVDLESELHTRTLNNKVYGQNQIKFDKQDMPEQYTFGWADSVTRPFVGYPINCLDNYVQKGNISEQNAADYDSDVDYVLSSPNDVSKDGFFLFALPAEGLGYSDTLKVENVTIKDEDGESYEVSIQNADAAFVKIHETWWRYHLPCENINVNNEDTVALTTGSFKSQSVEFADVALNSILLNVDNCNKIIRTQQGDGHVKTLSINLNSLATKADLLFNFVGRWYYLRGTALGASITISVNGESVTIDVSNNTFKYRYKEPISALDFSGTDVVSVNFADCDNLNNLTSADEMFKNCAELLAVDFANKTFGAVTTANDMFAGCNELTTLICPPTESWKADLDFSDCPNLTLESLNDLINDFLYSYDSGVHTITPNSTMWNALAPEEQTDIMAKATAKGWQIGIPAQYAIVGTSNANTVYATINGNPVEIPVSAGAFRYEYNNPITAISFENDANVTSIDFTESDLLAGVTSLNNAFKGCASLVAVDFHDCDLSNVATAVDCFSGCVALTTFDADSGVWKPDVDFSDCALLDYYDMQTIVGILYTYATGTHTITFNQTYWDTLTQAQQQTIFDAAQLKYWTTNAVMVVYYIRGKSTAASETFIISFIDDEQTITTERITINVDSNGEWEYSYVGKKIESLQTTFFHNSTITEIEFTEDFGELTSLQNAFNDMAYLTQISFSNNATFASVTNMFGAFATTPRLTTINNLSNAIFSNVTTAEYAFYSASALTYINLSSATFTSVSNTSNMFNGATSVTAIDLSSATFNLATNTSNMFYNCNQLATLNFANSTTFAATQNASNMFRLCKKIKTISLPNATFASVTNAERMFEGCTELETIDLPNATFAAVTNALAQIYNCPSLKIFNVPNATYANATSVRYFAWLDSSLQTMNMNSATFEKVTNSQTFVDGCTALTTVNVPNISKAILPTSSAGNTPLNFAPAPLTYQSMLNIANWISDLSGQSAHTITFKASAWNALSAAEQATIQGILQNKNWNLALA